MDENHLWRAVKVDCLSQWCIRQLSRIFLEQVDHRWARQHFEELESEERLRLNEERLCAADLEHCLLTPGGGDDDDDLIERSYRPVLQDGYHGELGGSD